MAQRIENFDDHESYKEAVKDITETLNKLDLDQPEVNIVRENSTTMELLKMQSQIQAKTLGQALEFIRNFLPLAEGMDDVALVAANPGDKVNVQAQKDYLEKIAKENYLVTKMIQQRENEKDVKAKGSYFDPGRKPICPIPPEISNGDVEHVNDSALKLLSSFKGDTDSEAENLKSFLRGVYDVATTNKLTETCTKAILKRKLQSTARRLIDTLEEELDDANRPTLNEIVLKLEDRYMAEWQPEIASAKLSMYTKQPTQTYQKMEGEISELARLAARGEKTTDKTNWIKNKKIAVFKQAVSEEDRQLLSRENQSRNIAGLPEMTLSQMVDYLLKNYSEQNAFATASNLRTHTRPSEDDSINTVQECAKSKKQIKKEKKEAIEKQSFESDIKQKEEAYGMFDNNTNQFNQDNFRGKGRDNRGNGRNYNNQGNRQWNNQPNGQQWNNPQNGQQWNNPQNGKFNPNFRGGQNSNQNQRGFSKPRKFVSPDMVNVLPNNCLKCNSPTHRFQETDKCIYGQGQLMTKPCFNCNAGGHHFSSCVKDKKQYVGAPAPAPPTQGQSLEPQFSKWPEASKTVPENMSQQTVQWNGNQKNEWMPSLFPY